MDAMGHSKKRTAFHFVIYTAILSAFAWQSYKLFIDLRSRGSRNALESIVVNVNGNVKRPGRYEVPYGTSHFEILRVAGIRNTSDLTPFNLTAQVESDQEMDVGTLEKPVAVKANARLEFFFGEITIISAEGRDRIPQEGMSIDEGDRILTEEKSQAELSVSTYSRIDMDNFSEITFDKIGLDTEGRNVIELFQKTGLSWYKIAYTEKDERFKTLTPLADATVSGKGADYTIDVKYSEVIINVLDGLLLIERPDGSDAMNLITGQSVTIFRDGRPFAVTKLSAEASATDRFNQLAKIKADIIMRHMPFNFLFFSSPAIYILVSVQFDKNTVHVVQLPANTSISFYVQGFTTLQESFLYGGVVFASTLIERIMNTRIQKYAVFDKDDIIRTATSIGGLKVPIDSKASAGLGIKKGTQLLKGQKIISFLNPSLSGYKDSEKRQVAILKGIFEQLQSKNIIVTSLFADQILTNIETNITATETMKHYNNFLSRKNWVFKSHALPIKIVRKENKTIYEPILEESRKLLVEQ